MDKRDTQRLAIPPGNRMKRRIETQIHRRRNVPILSPLESEWGNREPSPQHRPAMDPAFTQSLDSPEDPPVFPEDSVPGEVAAKIETR